MRPPMGATATGQDMGTPRSRVDRSISRMSTRMSWRMARRSRARRFRLRVISVSAAPSEVPRVAGQDLFRVLPDLWEGDEFVGHGSVQYCGAALQVKHAF